MRCTWMRPLHPVAKLLAVVAVSLGLALSLRPLLPGAALMTLLLLLCDVPQLASLGRALRRVRWLLLSIILLHGYLTPGEAAWPLLGELSPSSIGLENGLQRAAMLLIMVTWAVWLMQDVSPSAMAAAITAMLRPLAALGFPADRLGRRLSLTLQAVEQVGERARVLRMELLQAAPPRSWGEGLRLRAEVLLRLFQEAEQAPAPASALPLSPLPAWRWRDRLFLMVVLLALTLAYWNLG